MAKIVAADVLNWATVALQLVAMGVTTVAKIRLAAQDAGWAADDARLLALDAEYARRLARRKVEAEG